MCAGAGCSAIKIPISLAGVFDLIESAASLPVGEVLEEIYLVANPGDVRPPPIPCSLFIHTPTGLS